MTHLAPGFTLLHADEALLVLDKPAGLLSVPGRGPENADCLSARVQAVYPEALVVHRLDMGTSGLLIMARSPQAQRQLSRAFASRQVNKRYVAVVQGRPATNDPVAWQAIDLPLIVDWPNRPRSKVDHTLGKPSLTRWRIHPTVHDTPTVNPPILHTRLELEPVTGRSHQLRVHLQAIGHPIVGDELYAPVDVVAASPRLLLHARDIALPHPDTGLLCQWRATVPF